MKLRKQFLQTKRRTEDRLQQFIKANLGLRRENSALKQENQKLKYQRDVTIGDPA